MTGDAFIPVFLAAAVLIVVLALVITRLSRNAIRRDERHDDLNANPHDGRGTATWIGVNKASGGDDDLNDP
ncbi:hypothetical protein [Salaquimonas pukyongi]|uniref:hypothetical protein n=1 Tax=Salaquimonas pukyongi TaxID=2712698 RepID=UPI00096BBB4C|nr:hypothetical protein [Salaquimonas pukyongi]